MTTEHLCCLLFIHNIQNNSNDKFMIRLCGVVHFYVFYILISNAIIWWVTLKCIHYSRHLMSRNKQINCSIIDWQMSLTGEWIYCCCRQCKCGFTLRFFTSNIQLLTHFSTHNKCNYFYLLFRSECIFKWHNLHYRAINNAPEPICYQLNNSIWAT